MSSMFLCNFALEMLQNEYEEFHKPFNYYIAIQYALKLGHLMGYRIVSDQSPMHFIWGYFNKDEVTEISLHFTIFNNV